MTAEPVSNRYKLPSTEEVVGLVAELREDTASSNIIGCANCDERLKERAADEIERLTADNARLRAAHTEACDAADMILARVTAELGRYLYDAPSADLSPLLAEHKVELTAMMFKRLYDATNRDALLPVAEGGD